MSVSAICTCRNLNTSTDFWKPPEKAIPAGSTDYRCEPKNPVSQSLISFDFNP
jgi:hypothetical protein